MSTLFRVGTLVVALFVCAPVFAQAPMVCDADFDGDVDRLDISLIFAARNQPATGPDDPRDFNKDGVITVNDGRACQRLCTAARCAVVDPNAIPVADAGTDQTVSLGDTVTLDGTGSSDADGDALTFAWQIISAPPASSAALSDDTAAMPTFIADAAGTYTVQLIVNDGKASSAPDDVVVITAPGNTAPVANAGPDQTVTLGATVTLDGSASSDVDGDVITYQWSLISTPTGSGAALSDDQAVMPTFVADLPGPYTFQLVLRVCR